MRIGVVMRLDDEYNNQKGGLSTGHILMAASFFVLIVLGIVLLSNRSIKKTIKITKIDANENILNDELVTSSSDSEKTQETKQVQSHFVKEGLTSNELDIWDDEKDQTSNSNILSNEKSIEEDHANQILIEYENGESEWVVINPYLTKNTYDYSGLVYQRPLMKYYENSQKISYMGVDVSKSQGFVDFNKVKKCGIEFAMICLGARGYSSGQLVIDENYTNNMKGAMDAGLYMGVYFCSQAITEEEAIEEAEFVILYLNEYKINYPVVLRLNAVKDEKTRTDKLTKAERTKLTLTFMKRIKEEGYIPMIYGSKQWLIKKLDLSLIVGYDIWLSEERDIPDYPYKFGMWQYSTKGIIDGIAGNANLNISFLDYSIK